MPPVHICSPPHRPCRTQHGPYKGRWLRASLADEYTRQYPVPGRASPSEWDVDMAELALEEAYEQAALFHFLDSAKEPEALNVD